ncbi:NAD(P)-binding protein [Paracoccus sp. (in: a-proteobacteria)]|uniref:NAD(P)-binding protein n=1 Tax=Paracoccus sp. TaxID=267 RepID=UPI003A89B34E
MVPKSIAIIGGGISGLSVAYTLITSQYTGAITVFEAKPTLGGNADTVELLLGTDYRGAAPKPFTRIADLGVNDINLSSYKRVAQAMTTINYCQPGFPDDGALRPLEDSACFFTPDGREIWTMDQYLIEKSSPHSGVVDLRFSLDNPDNPHSVRLKDAEQKFMQRAAQDFGPDQNPGEQPEYWTYSVRRYVEYFRNTYLTGPAPLFDPAMLDEVARLFLMPRIAAMYFAADTGPEDMPFRGVMNYYRLQEGYGTGKAPDRRYFTHGSQDWINALANWLQGRGVTIVQGFRAQVASTEANGAPAVIIRDAENQHPPHVVDAVVMAAHADDQLNAFSRGDTLLDEGMASDLGRIQHAVSRAVAHTWAEVLPSNVGCWRSYNVTIRSGQGLMPYQMTYVENRHRNDALSPEYDRFGLPTYFVTLNPAPPIPDAHVLRLKPDTVKGRLGRRPGFHPPDHAGDAHADKAVIWFRHTVMTPTLLDIQDRLPQRQGMSDGRVFFAGCWTNGAGLHEQCFEQAERVVAAMGVTQDT